MTAACFLILMKWCLPKVNPFSLTWRYVRDHVGKTHAQFYVLTLLGIICLDILETRFDDAITHHLRLDFTSFFLHVEGSAGFLFQLINFPGLTYALSVVYLYVFPVIGAVAILATYHGGENELGRKIFWASIFNYILILPFYILVPVSERWTAGTGDVTLLMNQVSPLLIEGLRPMSGLNNCFPSFHTSLVLSFAMIVSKSANKRLRRTLYAVAALTIYSTLYLGFHWVLDVLAGVLFASACSLLAAWAVDNFRLELGLYRAR